MNKRRKVVFTLGMGALALTDAVRAQRPTKVHQIGYLIIGSQAASANRIAALRAGLRDLGYIEGKNLTFIFRSAATAEQLAEAAADFVRINVDVIFATSSTEVEAARRVTKTIPTVFATHADPVGVGHVSSLRQPGGNITGLSMLLTELVAKELELMKESLPHMKRVGLLLTSTAPSHVSASNSITRSIQTLGLEVVTVPVQTPSDLDEAFVLMGREHVHGFLAVASALTRSERLRLAELALKYRLAGMFGTRENVEAGGLMSYAPDLLDMTRRAAIYIDKILKGAKPADLPVEQAMRFELVLNMKTAKMLGITFPQTILIRADHMIQ